MGNDSSGTREPPLFDLIEESVQLLKRIGPGAYAAYATGTLGFLWSLLAFFSYMSRNARAPAHLVEYSFLLALAFVAMKAAHAWFFSGLLDALHGGQSRTFSWRRAGWMAATQALFQPAGLFLVPLALVFTLPFPWTVAFFQNAQWVESREAGREGWRRHLRLARLWPVQNLYIQLFLAAAYLCIGINIAATLLAVPQLLKSLLGLDTVFTRSPHAYFNTTFLMVVLALSWAMVDPLVKALYAVRCFRGESVKTGTDLRVALGRAARRIPTGHGVSRASKALALAALFLLPRDGWSREPLVPMASAPPAIHAPKAAAASAGISAAASAAAAAPSPSALDRLLQDEISDSRYSWRMSNRIRPGAEEPGFLVRWIRKAGDWIVASVRNTTSLLRRIRDWIDSLFGKSDTTEKKRENRAGPSEVPVKSLLLVLLVVLLGVMAALLLRRRSVGDAPPALPADPGPKAPDLTAEDVRPDELPEDEWLRLMETLRLQGEHRLAMRALFLALLSLSARKGWLAVDRFKSNRDYLREVSLKSKREPLVADIFRESCRRFERVWYGRHPVTEEDWEISRANFAKAGGYET